MSAAHSPITNGNQVTSKQHDDLYLTMAPRGLESFVTYNINSQLSSNGYSCWITEIGPSPSTKLRKTLSCDKPENESHDGSIRREKLGYPLEDVAARIEFNKYKKRMKKRKKEMTPKSQTNDAPHHTIDFDTFLSQKPDLSRVTGSVDVPEIESHVSLGYHTLRDDENSEEILQRILSVPGTTEGIALLSFRTNAPPIFVASMSGMGCGPLLALITSSCLQMRSQGHNTNSHTSKLFEEGEILDYGQTLEQSCLALETFFNKNKSDYLDHFQSALLLWHEHAEKVWYVPNSIYGDYHGQSKENTESTQSTSKPNLNKPKPRQRPFSYRLSCMRTHSKKYSYQREALLPYLGRWVIPWDDLHQLQLRSNSGNGINSARSEDHASNLNAAHEGSDWVVNLKDYDVEILTIIHSCCVSVAIPLRPYQLWSSKAYSSNTLPTDGTGMFGRLGVDARTKSNHRNSFVHLRPSTAGRRLKHLYFSVLSSDSPFFNGQRPPPDILISIANLPRHSVILDPCAGIGTVTIRASLQSHFGLGGDILPALFQEQAPYFHQCNRKFQRRQYRGAADMAGWDATMLPIRESFVDAVISDIPFGQKCLSHNELNAFMSGFVYECARVLVENNGKMILLCGDYEIVLSSLACLNERSSRSSTNEQARSRRTKETNSITFPSTSAIMLATIKTAAIADTDWNVRQTPIAKAEMR
eukprot:CCRYP_002004-RA/>CCRYP_002004-RA protein AED:0.27 eAED:0.27 QI:403/0.33/0.25/1/0/0/4/0/698